MKDIYCPCLYCGVDVLLTKDYEGYVPGYWAICPRCLNNEKDARLWLDPFANFVQIAESFRATEE